MITKEQFMQTIQEHAKFNKNLNDIENALGIEIYDMPLIDLAYRWYDRIFDISFTEEGLDIINNYLFEHIDFNDPSKEIHYYEKDDIIIETDDELWEYVKQFRCN